MTYQPLQMLEFTHGQAYVEIHRKDTIDRESAATVLFHDFRKDQPVVFSALANATAATREFKIKQLRSAIVVDDQGCLLGYIYRFDLDPHNLLRIVESLKISVQCLRLVDLLTTREHFKAIRYDALLKAKVGDVLKTLENSGYDHLFVLAPKVDFDKSEAVIGTVSSKPFQRSH